MQSKFRLSFLAVAVLGIVLVGCTSTPKSDQASADQPATTAQGTNAAAPFASTSSEQSGEQSEKKSWFGGESEAKNVPTTITVPAGTVLAVRLQNSVSSATANAGDSFDAVLDAPLVVNGKTVAAKGAPVTGRVVEAKSSGRLHDSGYIRLTLASIEINGKSVPVETSSLFAKGANHNKRNAALIGGGTGAGALIGGLAGGGKGALIGGLVGAGAGTGGAYATGKKDVGFAAERRLSFRVTQAFTTKS